MCDNEAFTVKLQVNISILVDMSDRARSALSDNGVKRRSSNMEQSETDGMFNEHLNTASILRRLGLSGSGLAKALI